MSAISNQWGACKSVNLDFFEEMTKMIGKWIEKGEKLAKTKKGLKVCVGITERLFFVQKPVRLFGACQQSMLCATRHHQGCHWTRKNEFYSVTWVFGLKTRYFSSKLRGCFGFWTSISQGNIKGDQWDTFKPLKAPPWGSWMCFKHFDHCSKCFRLCFTLRCVARHKRDCNTAKGTAYLRNCIKRLQHA